jgi:hypothetical protein
VKRRLAISALIPQILNAYRDGEIEPETMQQLTLATAKQQKGGAGCSRTRRSLLQPEAD